MLLHQRSVYEFFMIKISISFNKENQYELKALPKSFFERLQGALDKPCIEGSYPFDMQDYNTGPDSAVTELQ